MVTCCQLDQGPASLKRLIVRHCCADSLTLNQESGCPTETAISLIRWTSEAATGQRDFPSVDAVPEWIDVSDSGSLGLLIGRPAHISRAAAAADGVGAAAQAAATSSGRSRAWTHALRRYQSKQTARQRAECAAFTMMRQLPCKTHGRRTRRPLAVGSLGSSPQARSAA